MCEQVKANCAKCGNLTGEEIDYLFDAPEDINPECTYCGDPIKAWAWSDSGLVKTNKGK